MKRGDQFSVYQTETGFTMVFVKDDNTIDTWVVEKEDLTKEEVIKAVSQLLDNIYIGWEDA